MMFYLWLKNLLDSEEGQDLIEYALIIALIVIVVALALPGVATAINGVWGQIQAQLGGG